jgi:hypothetical protein
MEDSKDMLQTSPCPLRLHLANLVLAQQTLELCMALWQHDQRWRRRMANQ